MGPITRDTTSCVFVAHSVKANSVRSRHGTTKSCYSLKATTKIPPPPHLRNENVPTARSRNTLNTQTPLKTGLKTQV